MSYCRFSTPDCDLYIFEHTGGFLECCSCPITNDSWTCKTGSAMLAHLEEHRRWGHRFPEKVVEEIKSQIATEGDDFPTTMLEEGPIQ